MRKRILGIFVVMLVMSDCLIVSLYMIGTNEKIKAQSMSQGIESTVISSQRGQILDRNLNPLTQTQEMLKGFVFPNTDSLSVDEKNLIKDFIPSDKPVVVDLKRNAYTSHIYSFTKTCRTGANTIATHLLGYTTADGNGVSGVEKSYDSFLKKNSIVQTASYYVDGRRVAYSWSVPVIRKNGGDRALVLTLDKEIQMIAEAAAEKYIKRGAIVIIDIATGDLIASVSSPRLDPLKLEEASADPNLPYNNRAFMAYNIGSVFKPVLAAAAIEDGLEDFTYTCTGGVDVDDVHFKCNNIEGHGSLDMTQAICQSCNTYFIALGLKLGYERIYSIAAALGFGDGSVLCPGVESASGSLPGPGEIRGIGDVANISFGQGLLTATPLQVCRLMAAIGGDGTVKPMNLVIGAGEVDTMDMLGRQLTGERRAFSEKTAAELRRMLKTVVDTGSGMKAQPEHGGAGGKTGSAQTGKFSENGEEIVQGWFAGFYPYENPKYAISIVAEDSMYGATASAPAFKYIADKISSIRSLTKM